MDTVSAQKRSQIMSRIRSKDTAPEIAVRKLTHRMGYRYRLHCADLPGKPDLVFPRRGCVIFVHGCFWHPHAGCADSRLPKSNSDYWTSKLAGNIERDRRVRAKLRGLGWRVMVIRECQTKNIDALQRRVGKFLG